MNGTDNISCVWTYWEVMRKLNVGENDGVMKKGNITAHYITQLSH